MSADLFISRFVGEFADASRQVTEVERLPQVALLPNLTLFALDHAANPLRYPFAAAEYVRLISRCSHLLFEGTRAQNEFTARQCVPTFEGLAYTAFVQKGREGNIHYLEEGFSVLRALLSYGVPRRLALFLETSGALTPILPDARQTMLAQYKLPELAHAVAKLFGAYNIVDIGEIVEIFSKLLNNASDAHRQGSINPMVAQLRNTHQVLAWYESCIRDYSIIAPTFRALIATLKGRTGVLVGAMHARTIERAYKSEPIEQPILWGDFVSRIPPTHRDTIQATEKMLSTLVT